MENSIDKTSLSGFILVLLILGASLLSYIVQASDVNQFEGTYPVIKPLVRGEFDFKPDRVEIMLSDNPIPVERIVVFTYDDRGRQVCILKPVYNGMIVITPNDKPDYLVSFVNGKVNEYELLVGANRIEKQAGFMDILTRSKNLGRRYGVQECLYPICQRCLEVCIVRSSYVLEILVGVDGALYPKFDNEGCPRCGKCIAACTQRVICRSIDLPHKEVPRSQKNGQAYLGPSKKELEKALEQMTY